MAVFTAIGASIFGAGTFLAGLTAAGLQMATGVAFNLLAKAIAGEPQKARFGVQGQIQGGDDVPRSINFGWNSTAGSLVYQNEWGPGGVYSTRVIAIGDLPIRELVGVEVDGAPVTLLTGSPHASYGWPVAEYRKGGRDHLWIKFHDGTQTAADGFLTGTVSSAARPYGASRIGRGVPYVIATSLAPERADGEDKPLFSGFPAYKFTTYGVRLYDISKDDTAGGEGDQRWDDPSTWGGDGDFLPPVQIYNLLRGLRFGGDWLYGLQDVPAARLPAANWIAAIGKARAGIDGPYGVESTYRAGGEVQVGAPIKTAIEALLTACQGRLAEARGVYTLHLGEPDAPVMSFTDADILSTEPQSFTPFFGLGDTINGIAATYPNPAEGWNSKSAPPLLRSELEPRDGNRRLMASVALDMVPYGGQVQRLMKSALAEGQRARRHTMVMGPEFWPLEPGDIVEWTSLRNGYVAKLFRVDGVADRANLDVMIDITEVDPADYDWDQEADYRPVVDGPLQLVGPAPQLMTGWQALPATLFDAGSSARRPSIEVQFDGGLSDVRAVRVQVREGWGDKRLIYDGEVPYPAGDLSPSVVLNGTFLAATDYEVRGIYVPFSTRTTRWSNQDIDGVDGAWLAATTPDVRVAQIDLDDNLDAAIRNVLATLPQDLLMMRQQLDDVSGALVSQIASALEREGRIYQGVGARYEENRAAAELALTASADATSALAQFLVNLIAETEAGTAAVLFRAIAASLPEGALANVALQLRAGAEDEWAEAVLEMAAFSGESGPYSRLRMMADRIDFVLPGATLPAYLLAVANEPVLVEVDDGTITPDLSQRRLIYQTVMDDDAELVFPTGAQPGFEWRHIIEQDDTGGHVLSVDEDVFITGAPEVSSTAGAVTVLDGLVLTLSPPRAVLSARGAGTVGPTLVYQGNFSFGGVASGAGFTLANVPIGAPRSDRLVVVSIKFTSETGGVDVGSNCSVQIGGVTANIRAATDLGAWIGCAVVALPLSSGESVDIKFFGESPHYYVGAADVYTLTRLASFTPHDSDDDSTTGLRNAASISLDVPANGLIVAAAISLTPNANTSWTGVVEDSDVAPTYPGGTDGIPMSAASASGLEAQAGRTVSAAWAGVARNCLLAAVSWS